MNPEDITLLSLLAKKPNPVHLYYFWEQAMLHETSLVGVDIQQRLKSLIEKGYVEIATDHGYDSLYAITENGRAVLRENKTQRQILVYEN